VALTKAVLKQSTSKSVATKEKSFNLLRSVVKLAPGSLTAQSTSVITNIQKSLIGAASAGGSNATSLTLATLSFLAAFVQTHPARSYASSLPQIANFIVKFINDKYQRVSLEALDCTGSLAIALAPVDDTQSSPALPKGYVAPIQQLYEAVCRVLASNNADSEVKDRALYAVGDLLTHEGDVLIDHYDKALPYVSARLNTEANQMAALSVINDIAISSSCSNAAIDQWLESVLQELPTLFRRCAKPNRSKALVVLATLLSR
jgi:cullin-associated NEDD8-dissociated protein 1